MNILHEYLQLYDSWKIPTQLWQLYKVYYVYKVKCFRYNDSSVPNECYEIRMHHII